MQDFEVVAQVLESGAEFFPQASLGAWRERLARAKRRLEISEGISVAALVGGTGSGKSSLFNALSGLQFAEVSDARPTTMLASAMVWGVDARAMLDHLSISSWRRIEHNSLLTVGDDQLDGLVLLDLPDVDSGNAANVAFAQKVIPEVDLLIWVLDPQKYADQLLHRDYLQVLSSRQGTMIAVVNQIDTVRAADREPLLADVRRVLDADGLTEVPIYATSATARIGLQELREALREATAAESIGETTARRELASIAHEVQEAFGDASPTISRERIAEVENQISQASGVPSALQALRDAQGSDGEEPVSPQAPARTMVGAIRDSWVAQASNGLPSLWARGVDQRVASADRIRRALTKVYTATQPPRAGASGSGSALLKVLAVVALIAGVGCAIAGVPSAQLGVRVGVAVAGLVLAGFLMLIARGQRKRAIERSQAAVREYEARVQRDIASVVNSLFVAPAQEVWDLYVELREKIRSVVC